MVSFADNGVNTRDVHYSYSTDVEPGESLLSIASKFRYWDIANWLLIFGADNEIRDEFGCTARMYAGARISRLLLDAGAGIDATDDEGRTARRHAVERRDLECVELLLARGAVCAITDKDGATAADIARDIAVRPIQDAIDR